MLTCWRRIYYKLFQHLLSLFPLLKKSLFLLIGAVQTYHFVLKAFDLKTVFVNHLKAHVVLVAKRKRFANVYKIV